MPDGQVHIRGVCDLDHRPETLHARGLSKKGSEQDGQMSPRGAAQVGEPEPVEPEKPAEQDEPAQETNETVRRCSK